MTVSAIEQQKGPTEKQRGLLAQTRVQIPPTRPEQSCRRLSVSAPLDALRDLPHHPQGRLAAPLHGSLCLSDGAQVAEVLREVRARGHHAEHDAVGPPSENLYPAWHTRPVRQSLK